MTIAEKGETAPEVAPNHELEAMLKFFRSYGYQPSYWNERKRELGLIRPLSQEKIPRFHLQLFFDENSPKKLKEIGLHLDIDNHLSARTGRQHSEEDQEVKRLIAACEERSDLTPEEIRQIKRSLNDRLLFQRPESLRSRRADGKDPFIVFLNRARRNPKARKETIVKRQKLREKDRRRT